MNWSLPIAAVATLLGWSGLCYAQAPTPSQQFKDWRYECLAQKPAAGSAAPKQVCLIQHEVRNGNSLVLATRVRIIGPQKQTVLFFLPPALGAKTPIGFSVDQGVMATTEVRQCNAQLCWAAVPVGDYLLAALKAGRELAVIVKPGAGESRLVVSLSGFTGAFTALQSAVQ